MLGRSLGNADRRLNFWCTVPFIIVPPNTHILLSLFMFTHSLLTRTLFELSRAGLSPHFTDDHTKEKLGVRQLQGFMASVAQSSAPPACSWACPLLLSCCPSCHSCRVALQQDGGPAYHFWITQAAVAPPQFGMERLVHGPQSTGECHIPSLSPAPTNGGSFMGRGKTFLLREQEKLDFERQCGAWRRLGVRLAFHSFPGCSTNCLNPRPQVKEHNLLPLTSLTPHRAPRGSPDSPRWQSSVQAREAYLILAHSPGPSCLVIITSKL